MQTQSGTVSASFFTFQVHRQLATWLTVFGIFQSNTSASGNEEIGYYAKPFLSYQAHNNFHIMPFLRGH